MAKAMSLRKFRSRLHQLLQAKVRVERSGITCRTDPICLTCGVILRDAPRDRASEARCHQCGQQQAIRLVTPLDPLDGVVWFQTYVLDPVPESMDRVRINRAIRLTVNCIVERVGMLIDQRQSNHAADAISHFLTVAKGGFVLREEDSSKSPHSAAFFNGEKN
jgi:predicted RNA-binding Zn-ribbon protein involved in translation (DUF1610 family)